MRKSLGILLVVVAAGSCAHLPPSAPPTRWDSSCLAKRGCPRATPPAPCDRSVATVALDELVRRADELEGARVIVRGPLRREAGGTCTLLACYSAEGVETGPNGLAYSYEAPEPGKPAPPPGVTPSWFSGDRILYTEQGCCNGCGSGLTLGDALFLDGPNLGCGGDESLICCATDAHGQEVVATGVLRRVNRMTSAFDLDGATVCAPPSS